MVIKVGICWCCSVLPEVGIAILWSGFRDLVDVVLKGVRFVLSHAWPTIYYIVGHISCI